MLHLLVVFSTSTFFIIFTPSPFHVKHSLDICVPFTIAHDKKKEKKMVLTGFKLFVLRDRDTAHKCHPLLTTSLIEMLPLYKRPIRCVRHTVHGLLRKQTGHSVMCISSKS